jgi:3-hydroxyisobutyrate dehydrogenase/2-hydroxy-3-oxopropionate reductase
MGSRIAHRLREAGHELVVWNRTRQRAEAVGAAIADSPADAARRAEVVITMVADPAALRAVTEGPDGVAAGARGGTTVVEMSTVGPEAVSRLRSVLRTDLLDAPVLGSVSEAEGGTLSIFVGGDETVFEERRTLLEALGTPTYVGPSGAGAAAKLVANTTLIGTIGVLGEALALGERLGLPRDEVFDVLAKTPLADQAARRRTTFERGEYPPRFPMRLARKDADLVGETGIDLRLVAAARSWLAEAEARDGDLDYSAVLAWIVESATRR